MASPAPSNNAQSEAKRRKLRKGTHSCWECKRRKMKCIFDPAKNSTICNGCRRRGSKCVSQDFPEEASLDGIERAHLHTRSNNTIYGKRKLTPSNEDPAGPDLGNPTHASIVSEPLLPFSHRSSDHHTAKNGLPLPPQSKYERLSLTLHNSLPSKQDTVKICTGHSQPPVLVHQQMTMPYNVLQENGLATSLTLLEIPEPDMHPVLIARHMLLLATFLQHHRADIQERVKNLSESPRVIMERLADLAISLVTTNDELLGSLEGLECILLETAYHANLGNLRRSWVSSRRAMSIAQLMGLNRSNHQAHYKVLNPKTKYDPQHMWFRMVFLDRHLCLMLGLSEGSPDRSMASDALLANDTPMGRLERIHCAIASRIMERNESCESSQGIALTRTLDTELQRAARGLPSKWWLIPNLETTSTESEARFWKTRQLFGQVNHYNLLNQLHLPYMLRSMSTGHKYEYSRITCVNASREVLSRFLTLRRFKGVTSRCRNIEFLMLMAAMTLLLAHIHSHRSEEENLLAHQYHSDRAMIEQAQKNVEDLNRLNSDALSAQSADLLRRLLTIEVETLDGNAHRAGRVSVHEAGTETVLPDRNDDTAVRVHVPYFGIIKIAREGMSREAPQPQRSTATTNYTVQPQGADKSSVMSDDTLQARTQMTPSKLAGRSEAQTVETMTPVNDIYGQGQVSPMVSGAYTPTQAKRVTNAIPVTDGSNATTNFAPQPAIGLSNPHLQFEENPDLAAGTEDWAFQGVDLAFFESLMRSAGSEVNGFEDWTMCGEMGSNERL